MDANHAAPALGPEVPPEKTPPIQSVWIVGAGWTGRQIAGQMAAFGITVRLIDPDRKALDGAADWIQEQRLAFAAQGYWPTCTREELLDRVALSTDDGCQADATLSKSIPDLVLESVPEQVALKRRILRKYAETFPAPTVIASNSSYFVPSTFAKHVRDPQRFAHFHFHVPIWRATIVDIASAPETSQSTRARLSELALRIGQTPLVNRAENHGYVFNWMLKSVLQSALQLLAKGVANADEIELAWKKATGMPAGPFGIMDQIGIDIIYQTISHARFVDGDDVWGPLLELLKPLIDQGHLGVKTGKGFFEYPDRQMPTQ